MATRQLPCGDQGPVLEVRTENSEQDWPAMCSHPGLYFVCTSVELACLPRPERSQVLRVFHSREPDSPLLLPIPRKAWHKWLE